MDIGWTGRPDVYYRKVIREDNEEVALDADMIRLLIAIDENKSPYQIAEEADMEKATFEKTIAKLLQQGLIEPVKKDIPVLDERFLTTLRGNLSKIIGPIAEILIEDVATEMNLNPSSIPVHQAAELITNLSLEIPDEESRIQFKKSIIAILNKIRR